MRILVAAVAVVAASALGGCAAIGLRRAAGTRGVQDPSRTDVPRAVSIADATHEYPGPPPPAQSAPGAGSPVQAVLAFARAYVNWTAGSVAADLRRLAAASVGQARAAMQLAAAEVRADTELRRGGIANHGTVEAVAALRGRRRAYVVVTRESTTAADSAAYAGLRPAWHVTVAGVRRPAGGGWVVSSWQPEG